MRVLLIAVVTGAHVVVIGGALLIQGCGTTRGPVSLPTEQPMPPAVSQQNMLPPVQISLPGGAKKLKLSSFTNS